MADTESQAEIVRAIEAQRADKDAYFRDSPYSPLDEDARDAFAGLAYYPVDHAYRLEGLRLSPYDGEEPEAFQMPTSTEEMRQAWRAGTLRFELGGADLSLVAYDLGGGSLFVPFQDATSGAETYGAGRYLDLETEPDGTYTLDFNLAYFPFCAYSPYYSCPLTPAENRLPVRIEAGERLAEGAAAG